MIKYTKEMVHSLALKFKKRGDFLKAHDGAYQAVTRNGWADEIFAHMENRMDWTDLKKVHSLTKKFKTITAFKERYGAGYTAIRLKGWGPIVFSHCKKLNYYTDLELISLARPFKNRKEFWDTHPVPAQTINKRNLNKKAYAHMEPMGNRKKRFIYLIMFMDSIYVGLTFNLKKRIPDHINDPSNKHLKEKFKNKESFIIISDHRLFDEKKAARMEEYFKRRYRNFGFIILNIAKTGGMGGTVRKWTFEKIQQNIKNEKIKSSTELKDKHGGAWAAAQRNGWLDLLGFKSRVKKAIRQLTLNGKLIKVWPSMAEAERIGKFNPAGIYECIKGNYTHHHGFKWEKA